MPNKFFILLLLLSFTIATAQSDSLFKQIQNAYQSTNYEQTIKLTNKILLQNNTQDKLEKINEIRAVCFYAMGKKDSSKISFIEILKSNRNYKPDPQFISPKIIKFFVSIKSDFERIIAVRKNEIVKAKIDSAKQRERRNTIIETIALSVISPGTGQLLTGAKTKGIIMIGLSTALLGSSIYFTLETNRLEKLYVNEADKLLIQKKYDDYNKAYKIRNVLLTSYGLFWLFTQMDLLVFNQEKLFGPKITLSTSLKSYNRHPQFVLSLKYSL